MGIYNISQLEIKSVVKAENKATGLQDIQYSKFLSCNQLIYVIKGEAEVVFDNTIIHNKPGNIVFLPQGPCANYHAKIISDEDCIAIFFHGNFPEMPALLSKNFLKNTRLPILFEKLYRLWLRKEPGYYNQCMSVFYSILSEMEHSETKYLPCSKAEKINNAVAYIHEHYADSGFAYQQLHELCGISYTYFKKLFLERFSVTPSTYVRHLKIQRACELLSTNKFTVTEVALACGFPDVCYFSKVFTNETGTVPSKWGK